MKHVGRGIATISVWAGVVGICYLASWAAGYACLVGVLATLFIWDSAHLG